MRAMILAAGRGERMRPLTDIRPKPLIQAGDKALISWNIEKLVQAGICDIIINHAWLGQQIVDYLGNGHAYGATLHYSAENPALETAGGIAQALPFFEDQPFLVINADIWTDWDACQAFDMAAQLMPQDLASLLLVPNPEHHPEGDFGVQSDSAYLCPKDRPNSSAYTLSGIGVYKPELFASIPAKQSAKSATLLHQAIAQSRIKGFIHPGYWIDVGTVERLHQLEQHLESKQGSRYT
ncbi:N-acetylmuramate alpha-1-phosphate uridylyltransferase MurU [Alcaligenes endophyticus]|uniref:Nucleotidyltransferase family protein n=1 Tax=Alcaligenes endophyticus TaxID=1929088 RepID=A0ABT8EMT5_9BURK|nr:nucleotidyltransferase family protein [Alcaligenes endophyticus]MCX5591556.1 nucleotidyltransferase family protein [Alcaligenes endophyticus]MDN4122563.1 nucleotidyltransferase family protein [Alcaligenes endophyticus]